ncbi:MAG: NAD(P)H-dependent oxidoreductase [Pseudomonadota bacterium]|jgi:putative NADPH-quinone reductase|nr:NAD(P)H-dependent oxidoreductase [Pseudomonadota bacterium]
MKTLIVLCHPLQDSLNAHLAKKAQAKMAAAGHEVQLLDLYAEGFDPRLSVAERQGYYTAPFDDDGALQEVEALILVFPTWWFGLPAMLKGWIDRSFLPGVAYDHDPELKALTPRLHRLRHVVAVTTLGSPAWIDRLVLRRPVYRALKWGVVKACAPKARFAMLSLYKAEGVAQSRADRFVTRLERHLERLN